MENISNIETNHKKNTPQSQVKFASLLPIVTDDDVGFVRSLSNMTRQVLNVLIWFDRNVSYIYPSQKTISRRLGCRRATVNEAIQKLCATGILTKRRRFNNSCLYRLTDYFYCADATQRLRKLLPALVAFPLALLMPRSENRTLTNKKIYGLEYYRSTAVRKGYGIMKPPFRTDIDRIAFKTKQLTDAGKIKLHVFPPDVIQRSLAKLRTATDVRDPYKYLYKLCLDDADINQITLDFAYLNQMLNAYSAKISDEELVSKVSPVPTTTPPSPAWPPKRSKAPEPKGASYQPWKGHISRTRFMDHKPLTERQQEKARAFQGMLGITANE